MNLQGLIDSMNASDSAARSGYHLTLGQLQDALAEAPAEALVVFDDGAPAGEFDSYRGYYIDISISDAETALNVRSWRMKVSAALQETFTGYKGGDYPASPDKPLWRSEYGSASGVGIMGFDFSTGSHFKLLTKQVD